MPTTLTGGCLCGAVRFECVHDGEKMAVCHCADCRKASGAAAAHILRVPAEALRIVRGEPRSYEKRADSGNAITRLFCPNCGSQLYSMREDTPRFRAIRAGALDDPSSLEVGLHIWTRSALPWVARDTSVPQHEGNRPT